ncbi:hypothetical protein PCASD_06368 [Puccinia coronata f. sp. avenae]|uniref:Uncharacterized protein n=1 Tax=Puccinia coronata f. sp. avenae TaxID=200324 RepID=A0A2N5UX75_9BASI|nr:hypothetical protein PCASD_06368 [Puccinia coronata f. sp. avenae]
MYALLDACKSHNLIFLINSVTVPHPAFRLQPRICLFTAHFRPFWLPWSGGQQ